ncbi:MAG: amidohydrolase family protein [Parcubacteria group bacterium]|nr:amidohydrolase family protein [Parcubacteria group bacterium]
MALDILIKNGTVIDGVGTPAYHADIAIKDGKIEKIGFLGTPSAKTTIDATGLFVAPGFIDINNASDRYWTLFSHPNAESLVRQGITTIIGGNCGSSLSPLTSGNIILSIQKWADVKKINVNWQTTREFFEEIKKRKLLLNFGTLVGHSTLRRGIIKDEFRDLDSKEFSQMKHLLEASINDGAIGFSTGLSYSHAKIVLSEEISGLLSILDSGKIYATHLRDEGAKLYESVVEAIETARKNKTNLEISHFKAVGKNNWPLFKKSLDEIHQAAETGMNINFDVYPYASTATILYTLLPDWIAVGGRTKLVENLKNQQLRARAISEMKQPSVAKAMEGKDEFKDIVIASGDIDKIYIGKTIGNIAKNQGVGVCEAIINLLISAEGRLMVFWNSLSEENLIESLKSPFSIIVSDGVAANLDDAQSNQLFHPRSFGSFTRVLGRYVREKNILSWEEAIKKMTALPALKMGLKNCGVIKDGYFADITVFNPETVKDLATYENPFQYSGGIHSVIINGKMAFSEGKIQNQGLGRLL